MGLGNRFEDLTSLALASVSGLVVALHYQQEIEKDQLYHVLSQFFSKGQTFLELFPPTSILASSSLSTPVLMWLAFLSKVLLCSLFVARVCQTWTTYSISHYASHSAVSIYTLYLGASHTESSGLQACNSSAELLVILVLLYAIEGHAEGLGTSCLGVAECLLVFALTLGCNFFDVVLGFIVVYISRISSIMESQACEDGMKQDSQVSTTVYPASPLLYVNPSKAVSMCKLLAVTLRSLALPWIVYIGIIGFVLPSSETAAGGNYNLRYLSARARRTLSPAGEASRTPNWSNYSIPPHSIVPYVPISLYLPKAGFLWHDEAVWLEELGMFGDASELVPSSEHGEDFQNLDEYRPTSPLSRVYFSDPIARRHPWSFEQTNSADMHQPNQEDYIRSHLWSGEGVYIRSRISGRYLGVSEGERSFIDREMNIPVSEDSFIRFQVGCHQTRNSQTAWTIEYDPYNDEGFRLYNPLQECHLATSFRPFPDWDGESGNDTVAKEINLVIETTCTRAAAKQASTLFLVEGTLKGQRQQLHPSLASLQPIRDHMIRGYELMKGLVSIRQSRRLYGEIGDVPNFLRHSNAESTGATPMIERTVLVIFLATHVLWLLWRKRGKGAENQNGHGSTYLWTHNPQRENGFQIGCIAMFVYGHVLAYWIAGEDRPFGGRLALIMALVGMDTIRKDVIHYN
ncbi:hypothetical protein SCAR479_10018 [Seiridium cardinale]|uniref:Uncharacterized protein n=1 Tax=Seiridium cardinale TaxID=138064 RepID=A0ABR2XHX3_9PEZI